MRQKTELREKISGIANQVAQIQEEKLAHATDYVSHHLYSMHIGKLEAINQNNKNKSAQIVELQEKILSSKSLLSQSAYGLAIELSALQKSLRVTHFG